MSKYAEGTSVPAERSRAEVESILKRYGADQFASGWMDNKAVVTFRAKGRYIRIEIPMPIPGVTRGGSRNYVMSQNQREQETRRRWRAIVLYVKAKLESVDSEIVSFEEAFMAHIVLPDRRTVAQAMIPQIDAAYSSGKMPPLLGYDG